MIATLIDYAFTNGRGGNLKMPGAGFETVVYNAQSRLASRLTEANYANHL
jgi:hypothetical protein